MSTGDGSQHNPTPPTPGRTSLRRSRILVGDDHPMMLHGIKQLLEPHFETVGFASDGRQLVDSALRLKPDVVVLDVSMPQLNGLEAAKLIRTSLPSTKLIFLTMHTNPMYLRKALDGGASGYVLKSGVIEDLLEAIRQVLDGKTYVSAGFGQDVLENLFTHSGKLSREEVELTARQVEILQLIAEGNLAKEIAHKVGISIKTVEFHRGRLMTRLGAHSMAELVRIAVEQGLIPSSTAGAP